MMAMFITIMPIQTISMIKHTWETSLVHQWLLGAEQTVQTKLRYTILQSTNGQMSQLIRIILSKFLRENILCDLYRITYTV